LRVFLPAAGHTTSLTIVSELTCLVNTSAFIVTNRGNVGREYSSYPPTLTCLSAQPNVPRQEQFPSSNQIVRTFYFEAAHEKFAASSVLPVPTYVATFG
jgi:hypothetical protein